VGDPRQAASTRTQLLALATMIGLYAVYVIAAGTGALLVLPVGVFLLLAVAGLGWRWWSSRSEKQAG